MFDSIFAHEPFVVFNVCFQNGLKIKKTTDSLKNTIILYKSKKKPESVNKLTLLTEKPAKN